MAGSPAERACESELVVPVAPRVSGVRLRTVPGDAMVEAFENVNVGDLLVGIHDERNRATVDLLAMSFFENSRSAACCSATRPQERAAAGPLKPLFEGTPKRNASG
jgi:hypothetical protein